MIKIKKILKRIGDYASFFIFRVRIFTRKKMKEISEIVKSGDKILEIGSGGKNKDGECYFSAEKYFSDKSVDFIKSDKNTSFGHKVIDVVNLIEKEEYDHILCFHVLDDVYEWQKAFLNLWSAIKIGGFLHIILPGYTPLDYPVDLFRFTDKLIKEFCVKNNIKIDKFEIHGFKKFPFAYYLRIKK
jgi:hypothetical protein